MQTIYSTLSKKESNKLRTILRESQGNIKNAKEATGLAVGTLKRAADGLRIKTDSALVIKQQLLN